MQRLLRDLGQYMLNSAGLLKLIYQRTSLKAFMYGMMGLDRNVLILGKRHVWLVQTSTQHPGHFVGTQRTFHTCSSGPDQVGWNTIKTFLLRNVTPGASVPVFMVYPPSSPKEPVFVLHKSHDSLC